MPVMNRILFLSGLAIETGCVALTWLSFRGGDDRVIPFILLMLFMGAAYLLFMGSMLKRSEAGANEHLVILIFTVIFYLTLLPGSPLFDDDMRRYLWDGKVTLSGINPYRYAPADMALKHLREGNHGLIGYPRLPTPYPPAAQIIFAVMRLVSGGDEVAAKAFIGIFFLGSVLLLARLLENSGIDRRLVAAYAWNPMVLKEFANSGHVEPAGILFLLAAVWALTKGRDALSGSLLAAASLVKFIPAFAAPLLFFRSRRRASFLAGFIAMGIALYLPFMTAGTRVTGSLAVYLRHWLFNHGPFEILFRISSLVAGPAGAGISRIFFWVMAGNCALYLGWRRRHEGDVPFNRNLGLFFFFLVVFSPTVMPWYLTWSVPLLAFRPSLPLLAFTVISNMSYGYYLFHRDLPPVRWVEYAFLAVFLLAGCFRAKKSRRG